MGIKTDMKPGESIDFLDYTIHCCENGDGIVLHKKKQRPQEDYECHLGNYNTKESAMQAAVIYYMICRPEVFAATIYYRCMMGVGQYHEFFLFKNNLLKAGYKMPKEITDDGTINFGLHLNGKPIKFK